MAPSVRQCIAASFALVVATGAAAQDRAAYDQRNVARYVEAFQALDRDRNDVITWSETQGDVDFTARFEALDVDRDGSVTRNELDRFLAMEHGLRAAGLPADHAPSAGNSPPAP
jgi:Ca2+-binding EF-hand superfamily protein